MIRAITFFLAPGSWSRSDLYEYVSTKSTQLSEAVRELGLSDKTWSLRISLPPLPSGVDPVTVASTVADAIEGTGIEFAAALHLNASDERLEALPEALEFNPIYASIRTPEWSDVEPASRAFLRISLEDPLAATRLAIDLQGTGLPTPYFPMSSNILGREGVAVALLYVDELAEAAAKGRLVEEASKLVEWGEREGEKIAGVLGAEFFGVDASPSPWMEHSVARVVETISGRRMPEPGTLHAVRRLNEAVWQAASRAKSVGFNEAMLAVAEDNLLMERVAEGLLRVRDLLSLTAACVSGVDMVVLPEDLRADAYTGLVADQKTMTEIKGRPLGTRMIVYPGASPGDRVDLGEFGRVPVADV